jgi:hypothetical protein
MNGETMPGLSRCLLVVRPALTPVVVVIPHALEPLTLGGLQLRPLASEEEQAHPAELPMPEM